MFWKKFLELCNTNQTTPNGVCAKIGLSVATATKWKNGSVPRDTTLLKIAEYFGVSVEYFLTEEKKPAVEDEPGENIIIFHRDGKTVKKQFTKEQMEMITKMLDAIPEKTKDI